MRELVAQRPIDFRRAVLAKERVQRDGEISAISAPSRGAQARLPAHGDLLRETHGTGGAQDRASLFLDRDVARVRGICFGKIERELLRRQHTCGA